MLVSSDSLFHFTKTLENLQGILIDKFKVAYCRERHQLDYQEHDSYYPMVSFCDLPLALAKNHIEKYGHYAIGLKKNWGIENGLNPVVYLQSKSILSKKIQGNLDKMGDLAGLLSKWYSPTLVKSVEDAINKSISLRKKAKEILGPEIKKDLEDEKEKLEKISNTLAGSKDIYNNLINMADNLTHLWSFIKNYQGRVDREGKIIDVKFYDEREWRYVPEPGAGFKQFLSEDEYQKFKGNKKGKPFIEGLSLPFITDDIKYLIVNDNNDIAPLIQTLNNLPISVNATAILSTKIFTITQLNEDF